MVIRYCCMVWVVGLGELEGDEATLKEVPEGWSFFCLSHCAPHSSLTVGGLACPLSNHLINVLPYAIT